MANNEKIVFDAELNSSGVQKSLIAIKTELKTANKELQETIDKFGIYSDQVKNAEQKILKLKNELGEASKLSRQFTAVDKLNAYTSALQGIAGGVSAVIGAQTLFGASSEEVEKQLAKVQGAMAFSQGIKDIAEAAKGFAELQKKVKGAAVIQTLYNAATKSAAVIQKLFTGAVEATGTGFKALRAAIVSTGIGALIVALGLLISKMMEWNESTEAQKQATEDLNKELENQNELLEKNLQEIEYGTKVAIAQAKIQGKSVKELRAIESKAHDDRLIELNKRLKATYDTQDKIDMSTKEGMEAYEKANKQSNDINSQILKEIQDNNVKGLEQQASDKEKADQEAKQSTDKANQKALSDQKEHQQKVLEAENTLYEARKILMTAKDAELADAEKEHNDNIGKLKEAGYTDFTIIDEAYNKKKADINKKYADEEAKKLKEYNDALIKIYDDIRLGAIEDEYLKEKEALEIKYRDELAAIEANENFNAQQKLALKLALQEKENQELDLLEEKRQENIAIKNIDTIAKLSVDKELEIGIRKQALDKEDELLTQAKEKGTITDEQYTIRSIDLAKAREEIAKEEAANRKSAIEETANSLDAVAELIGKHTVAGKGMAVAAATMQTYSAANDAYKRGLEVPYVGMVLGPLNAAIAIAQGISRVKKILSVQVPGKSGGVSAPNISAGNISAPIAPQIGGTELNQMQVNQLSNAANRAFVLESDVSGNQERIQRLNRAARIN